MTAKIFLSFFLLMSYSAVVAFQVDYESEIQPVFSENCTTCHGGTSGVTLSSYENVMSSVGMQYEQNIVFPGEPDESPIIDKISNDNPENGVRMPYDGPPYLSEGEIDLIRTWIAEGANEMPVSNEIVRNLPEGYRLLGNYPNPFNPVTKIVFEVPEAVSYQVKIYTISGAIVEEVAGSSSAGVVSVRIGLQKPSSGVYFFQVTATSGDQKYLLGSDRMTLVK